MLCQPEQTRTVGLRRQECILDLSSEVEEVDQSVKDASFYLCRYVNQRWAHTHTHTHTHTQAMGLIKREEGKEAGEYKRRQGRGF